MKTRDIIARLRKLQADAYGMYPFAQTLADRDLRERKHSEERDRYPFVAGSMKSSSRWLAMEIDQLIEELRRRPR